ncbi:hypothetical protein NP493_505g02035 [Ridgeia piscesae]|uniref:Uncharacterized protein n=1 Tax=Ridgeia piscesae TaxID=27915 RepID=A0AAD9KXG8_RIDPI|nr:hypothetical protein NP493_505g02035 [Ridgeia piscesae]
MSQRQVQLEKRVDQIETNLQGLQVGHLYFQTKLDDLPRIIADRIKPPPEVEFPRQRRCSTRHSESDFTNLLPPE